ncbi:hypothetical protein EV175_000283 [Coemansia sp. RSA 1933]|nr:hypothetical protein EV175_000283 [Coemansia sp. RSA 1933]
MYRVQGIHELTAYELTDMYAPILDSIDEVKERLKEEGKFILFYFRGQAQKDAKGSETLFRFVQLAQTKGFGMGQWNSRKYPGYKDFFNMKYEIKGGMGAIVYRDRKYLTSVRDIKNNENAKFADFEKMLSSFGTWPVRQSPKQVRIAYEEAIAAKEAKKAAASTDAGCCVIL